MKCWLVSQSLLEYEMFMLLIEIKVETHRHGVLDINKNNQFMSEEDKSEIS